MAYKALYREYRPRRFFDLRGQGMISEILKNQVKAQEPSHAYIFIGPRGTGKTSTAKIFGNGSELSPSEGRGAVSGMRKLPRGAGGLYD